ncbi:hypothetical protein [Mycetocola reblochoni]|uniref:hypothetical protein n=1 Tax=Mycetocola reblochoni TaxID=331618 RepID=UPI0011815984|nr:hypothetical protein [Mycetocola reblochoni]
MARAPRLSAVAVIILVSFAFATGCSSTEHVPRVVTPSPEADHEPEGLATSNSSLFANDKQARDVAFALFGYSINRLYEASDGNVDDRAAYLETLGGEALAQGKDRFSSRRSVDLPDSTESTVVKLLERQRRSGGELVVIAVCLHEKRGPKTSDTARAVYTYFTGPDEGTVQAIQEPINEDWTCE